MFNSKKKFFKSKINQVEKTIWDLEFKLFKVREMREERRLQRDRTVEAIDAFETQIKADHKDETKKELERQLDEQKKYKDKLEIDLLALDVRISGAGILEGKPEQVIETVGKQLQYEDYQGVLNQIEAGRELLEMYKSYIKNNL